MINDFVMLFSKPNRYLIRRSLGKGAISAALGSVFFTLLTAVVSFVRSSSFPLPHDPEFFEATLFLFGFVGGVAFLLTFPPVTVCIALFTLRMQSLNFQTANVLRKFVLEGALTGGGVSLCIGLFASFLNGLLIESIGKGSMIGVTIFTLEAIVVGTIVGGMTALLLVKQKHSI